MTLHKDASIVQLIQRLKLERRGWAIRDYWEADLCAIGVSSTPFEGRLVYISTFGKPTGKYDYQCEQLRSGAREDTDYEIIAEGHNVDYDELVAAIERHLGSDA